MTEFRLTDDHIKLLRRANVRWNGGEWGAPGMDTKRPYGNSSVFNDIHEILTSESIGMVGSPRDGLTDEENDRYYVLHRQMEHALQIVLTTGEFTPGVYVQDRRYNWVKKENVE